MINEKMNNNPIVGRIAKPFIWIYRSLSHGAAFLVFMYTLGLVCTYAVVPAKRGWHAYTLAPEETFFDVACLCVLLWLLPGVISRWVRRAFYVVAYLLAVVDVYCFVKFDTTITPTMLLLIGETNKGEATEFLKSYLSADIIFSRVGRVLLVMLAHMAWAVVWHYRHKVAKLLRQRLDGFKIRLGSHTSTSWLNLRSGRCAGLCRPLIGVAAVALFIYCGAKTLHNKAAFVRLMTYDNIGDVEHELTEKGCAVLYQPIYRLVFSVYANRLTSKQVDKLVRNIEKASVDSCTFRSDNIVLVIGESYNRHHASLYGYDKETTPLQQKRAVSGQLVPYSDVIAPWNLTSYVFKHLFSLYTVGDKGEWCDYPLFPELFRKAGYHVTFLTNQFLPQAKEAVYDFSGGFFLNNPQLSAAQFDTRNTQLFRFDAGLLNDYDKLKKENKEHNLIILHLKGQHVDYRTRFPRDRAKFTKDDYDRPQFTDKERRIMADYDNAILYNDSIMDQILQRFDNENAVVIYVPDHGEECYEGDVHFYGRMHSTEITARLAREEFDIPFWIWCSHSYIVSHPEIYSLIVKAKDRRYMTDALPHLLLYLAGIHTPWYNDKLNIISPEYNESRPRLMKHTTDYDKLDWEKH